MNVDIQVNTKTTEHLETSHTIAALADLPALITNEKAKHQDVTSITATVVYQSWD